MEEGADRCTHTPAHHTVFPALQKRSAFDVTHKEKHTQTSLSEYKHPKCKNLFPNCFMLKQLVLILYNFIMWCKAFFVKAPVTHQLTIS